MLELSKISTPTTLAGRNGCLQGQGKGRCEKWKIATGSCLNWGFGTQRIQRPAEAGKKGEELTNGETGFENGTIYEDQPLSMDPLPLIVIKMMADLMMVAVGY